MKKYLLSLCALVSIGQCYSMSTYDALMKLYSPIHALPIEQITYTWLKNFKNIVAEIATNAIEKSKDALNRRDINLTAAATEISDISNEIFNLYMNIKINVEKLKKDGTARSLLSSNASLLTRQLTTISQKIGRSYITISKQQAQRSLQETIQFLKNPILTGIEQELELLNPTHFA